MSLLQVLAIGFLSLILVAQESCTKDTCNDVDTFTQMDASASLLEDNNATLNISWTSGKILPKEYFENIFIFKAFLDKFGAVIENDSDKIENIEINSSNNLTINLTSSAITETLTELNFHLFFPDREDFIDCVHPGSNDEYQLDLFFSIEKSADSLVIVDFKWEETFFPGPF